MKKLYYLFFLAVIASFVRCGSDDDGDGGGGGNSNPIVGTWRLSELKTDAWIDYKKTKVGYEIPMNRFFYKYMIPEETESILSRLNKLEADITASLKDLFGEEVK